MALFRGDRRGEVSSDPISRRAILGNEAIPCACSTTSRRAVGRTWTRRRRWARAGGGTFEVVRGRHLATPTPVARRPKARTTCSTRRPFPSVQRSIEDPAQLERGQRHRYPEPPARRPRRRRQAIRLRPRRLRCTARARCSPRSRRWSPRPISPYALQKLAGETYCRLFHSPVGEFRRWRCRYFNVFGPRQDPGSEYSAVVPRFVTAIKDGQANPDHLRRRRADPRLHLRQQRRAGQPGRLARPASGRLG